ncbi:hypothetical protein [Streptomyces sp. NPDC004270]
MTAPPVPHPGAGPAALAVLTVPHQARRRAAGCGPPAAGAETGVMARARIMSPALRVSSATTAMITRPLVMIPETSR